MDQMVGFEPTTSVTSLNDGNRTHPQQVFTPAASAYFATSVWLLTAWFMTPRLSGKSSPAMEQVKGIEPSSTVWKTVILTIILHLHIDPDPFSRHHSYRVFFCGLPQLRSLTISACNLQSGGANRGNRTLN